MKKNIYRATNLFRIIPLLFLNLLVFETILGEQELQIYQINIGNGDGTTIGVFDRGTDKYISKVLIDGGHSTAFGKMLPYIHKIAADTHFNYIILTHYHNDHYTG